MKLFTGILTLLLALTISATAAYFSVVGLAALFAATFIPVIVMGAGLEAGKLMAAAWLHTNWRNKRVGTLLKVYLSCAVIALMLITAIGIYGFLSKGHLEQEAPLAGIELQIQQREMKIAEYTEDNKRLQAQLDQLDQSIATYLRNDRATQGLKARKDQRGERDQIRRAIDENTQHISAVNDELVPLRLSTSEVEAKLGPVKYVAELFGWKDVDSAVRFVILTLMFAFDPLAITLLISSTITIGEYFDDRRTQRAAALQAETASRTDDQELQTTALVEAIPATPACFEHPADGKRSLPVGETERNESSREAELVSGPSELGLLADRLANIEALIAKQHEPKTFTAEANGGMQIGASGAHIIAHQLTHPEEPETIFEHLGRPSNK